VAQWPAWKQNYHWTTRYADLTYEFIRNPRSNVEEWTNITMSLTVRSEIRI